MPKRARESDVAWTILVPKASLLTNMVQAVANLSQTICMTLSENTISTQAVSSAKSCMVTARLCCVVEWAEGSPSDDTASNSASAHTFCLDARTLLNALRTVHETQTLQIRRSNDDDAPITVAAVDEVTSACTLTWRLPVLVEDSYSVTLDTLDYEGEWVYDVSTLKADIKRCRAMDCDDVVTLRMWRMGGSQGQGQPDEPVAPGNVTAALTEMAAEGARGAVVVRHTSATTEDDASAEVADVTPSTDCDDERHLVMEQAYCVENLCDFLKAVDHSSIKLLLATGKPLVAEVSLGGDDSRMSFVQGPHVGTA